MCIGSSVCTEPVECVHRVECVHGAGRVCAWVECVHGAGRVCACIGSSVCTEPVECVHGSSGGCCTSVSILVCGTYLVSAVARSIAVLSCSVCKLLRSVFSVGLNHVYT